uniref:Cadherin domain-containing protein n=1 Tax=Gongylonema pulchrum TaxID=637853 RepID=A0A183DE24_9BILA
LEPGRVYNLTVIATDRGIPPLSTTTFAFVHVAAQKDCIPNFETYPTGNIEIDDNSVGEMIAEVHAIACGAEILYSFNYGNASYSMPGKPVLFWMDPVDGSLFLLKFPEMHVGQRIELLITAKTLSGNATVPLVIVVAEKKEENSGLITESLSIPGTIAPNLLVVPVTPDLFIDCSDYRLAEVRKCRCLMYDICIL